MNQKFNFMKKLNYFLLGLAALGMVFTSCEDDEALGPEITFKAGDGLITADATINKGETASFSWEAVKGDAKLTSFTIRIDNQDVDGFPKTDIDKEEYQSTWAKQFLDAGTYAISFIAEDKDGKKATETITVTVKEAAIELTSFTAVLMGGQTNTTTGSFLDADAGKVYLTADAKTNQSKVDVVYYFGSENKATLASPNDETVNGTGTNALSLTKGWTTQNATKFNTNPGITAAEFDAMTDDSKLEGVDVTASKANMLSEGDVAVFMTAAGNKGAIKVVKIDGEGSGTITIDVKIQ